MKTLLTVCLLMLSCVAQAMPPKAPAPLWTAKISSRRVSDSEYRPDARIAAAASEVAVIVSEPGTVTALDARTGKERWAFQSSPSTLKDRGSRWDVVGTSGDAQGHAVVVLVRADPAPLQIGTQKSQPTKDTFFALHGVEAATGQRLWRKDYAGPPPPYLLMRHGVVLVPSTSRSSNGTYRETHWEYLDAQTGEPMDLDARQSRNMLRSRALLRRILLSEGGTILENHVSPVRRLRADTGTSETIPMPDVGQGYISPQFTQNGIIVSQAEPFGGFTGHSSWPKYLVGSDAKGREFWRFPTKTAWSKEAPDTMGAPESLMRNVVAVPNTSVFLAEDTAKTIYGLRLRDGKTLWKLSSAPFRLPLALPSLTYSYYTPEMPFAIYGAGCFAYAPSSDQPRRKPNTLPHAPTIVYISALTGKTIPLLFNLPVQQVTVGGDTLFVQTASGTFRAYSLAAFPALRTTQKLQHQAAMLARKPAAIARLLPLDNDLNTWQTFGQAVQSYRMEDGAARIEIGTSGSTFQGGIASLPFAVFKGQSYRFVFEARTDNPKADFFAGLFHAQTEPFNSSSETLNEYREIHPAETWQRVAVTLFPDKTDIRAVLCLGGTAIERSESQHATLWIRNVSLQAPAPIRKSLLSGKP